MKFTETITATDFIWLAGLIIFACWLLDTSLGRKALLDSPPRRNSMPPYLPFIPLFLWFGAVSMTIVLIQKLTPGLQEEAKIFRDHLMMSIGAVVTIAAMMLLAHIHFARRLKGFGLNIKTIAKDFVTAIINLLAVWPLMLAAVQITTYLAKLIWGTDYQIQPHEQLEMITEYTQLPNRIMIVFVAVVIAPFLEEMMFRGFVQTTIRSYLGSHFAKRSQNGVPLGASHPQADNIRNSAWPAITVSSVFFALMHANPAHWPALFILGMCLGYSYEKSGSLFRPIFIHLFFNASSVATVLFLDTKL
jgi:membrane protease YdiL (CAAX protease family)